MKNFQTGMIKKSDGYFIEYPNGDKGFSGFLYGVKKQPINGSIKFRIPGNMLQSFKAIGKFDFIEIVSRHNGRISYLIDFALVK